MGVIERLVTYMYSLYYISHPECTERYMDHSVITMTKNMLIPKEGLRVNLITKYCFKFSEK